MRWNRWECKEYIELMNRCIYKYDDDIYMSNIIIWINKIIDDGDRMMIHRILKMIWEWIILNNRIIGKMVEM